MPINKTNPKLDEFSRVLSDECFSEAHQKCNEPNCNCECHKKDKLK